MKSSITAALSFCALRYCLAAPVSQAGITNFTIQWGQCSEGSPAALDCGQMQVPLDWNDTSGEQITLGMYRVKASNSSERIGSLMFNPGGPGAPATDFCLYQAAGVPVFSDALAQHFDLVCPDPRGVGISSPVECDPESWNQNATYFPSNGVEFGQLLTANKARGQSCLDMTGPLLQHIDTISAAKDIEAIRQALDDGKLNWLGLSYGSQLGSTYAQLYPENVRTMALDGILDHTQSASTTLFMESSTYENVLDRFFDWCTSNATACTLQGDNLPKMFDDLVKAADKTPIPAPGCDAGSNTALAGSCQSTVTGNDIILNVQALLLFKYNILDLITGWDYLGLALNQTIAGDNATLLSNSLAVTNTSIDFSETAISCLDWIRSDISNTTQAFTDLTLKQLSGLSFNPHIGSASQTYSIQTSCLGWPAEVVNPQQPLDQEALKKSAPILLVNSEHDPSTSYEWALDVKAQIPNSVLVTRAGDGHTSYYLRGEAAALIDTYLVEGTLPTDGLVVDS